MRIVAIGLMFLFLVLGQPVANAQRKRSEIPSNGTAEAPKEPETLYFDTLTLDQAIAFALTHAAAIQEAELTVALAELDLKRTQFWRRLVPSLTLHHGYNPVVGESRIGIGLSLDFNQIWEETDRAKAAKLKWFNSSVYRKTVKNQVILSVTQSYYDFVAAKKQVELLEEQLSTDLKLQEIQKIQFESGQAQLAPLLNMLQTVATTQLTLMKAQAEVKLKELKIKSEIGWDDANGQMSQ
jgi:outer membrane protein TolC